MNRLNLSFVMLFAIVVFAFPAWLTAQLDTVERIGGGRPVRGRIIEISSTAVVVESGGTNQTINVADIRKVNIGAAKGLVRQAISQYYGGNYNDCLDLIERNTDAPTNKYIIAELAYCKAMSMANEAIAGGTITLKAAGSELSGFLTKHADSYRYYPASQTYAKLLLAINRFDVAKETLNAILMADWPTQVLSAHIELGKIALIEKEYDAAARHFKAAMQVDSNDQESAEWKLIAKCRLAQSEAMTGDTQASIKTIEEIIKKENSENKKLFSNVYNSLGHCHLKSGDKKAALLAFLHTQMLFAGQSDTQSEALYQLFHLWNDLNYPDRARDAQKQLASSFRNTYYGNPDIKRDN